MTKKFFVSVSPKAVEGIRKAYQGKNAEIHTKVQRDGTVMVVVMTNDEGTQKRRSSGGLLARRSAAQAVA